MAAQDKQIPSLLKTKTTLRDATIDDIHRLQPRVKYYTKKFFGDVDLTHRFRCSAYSIVLENENHKIAAFANIENTPNIPSLPKGHWMDWLQYYYNLPKITYGNTLFLTFLMVDDPTNTNLLQDIFREIFIREPKIKFICTVGPPVDSQYEDILQAHCKQIYPLEESVTRLCQALFVCERYNIIPKMRLRRALAEDNDDLVEIIDEQLKIIRQQLGDYYISEQVLRDDPTEHIVVAEIANVTIGMIWVNTNLHRRALTENFETAPYGHFLKPKLGINVTDAKVVTDITRKPSGLFFDKTHTPSNRERRGSDEHRLSLNNLYVCSSDSSQFDTTSKIQIHRSLFTKWQQVTTRFKNSRNYSEVVQKVVRMPKSTDVTNAFAIQMFGLTQSIDPRRIYDLVSGAFAAYPYKDYCIISISSGEASSDCLAGPLLRYFSRMVPRPGCKISDCLYVTHKNSFLTEIELSYLTEEDIPDVENLICADSANAAGMYHLADMNQQMRDYLDNPWSSNEVLIIRSGVCPIGFAVICQNSDMAELHRHFVLFEDDDIFLDWEAGLVKYLHIHPAFTWEWVHVYREIFRLTGFYTLHFKMTREHNKPILNTLLFNMFPVFPRKRITGPRVEPYALYYQSMKLCHIKRVQIENKVVIVGFNETCKGFLRTLLFSDIALRVQCLNLTVITPFPGYIEAEHDITSFEGKSLMFFRSKNQFDSEYLLRLELRTWVAFIGGVVKGINGDKKRIMLEDGSTVRYDKLFLMCSTRYNSPKPVVTRPVNFITMNGQLDRIVFYHQIKILQTDFTDVSDPILIFGNAVSAHSCVHVLMQMGINPAKICFVIPRMSGKVEFPENFDDSPISDEIFAMEKEAGVVIYKNLNFVDWKLHSDEAAIESVIFESDFERILLKCSVFISYHGYPLSEVARRVLLSQNILMKDNRIVVDEYSRTNIPSVYACGRISQYDETLFAKSVDQRHYNQLEVGNKLALNFIMLRLSGERNSLLDMDYFKPLFRQHQLIGNLLYAGLRKPGRYLPRDIRKNLHTYGHDIITRNGPGEYCRILLDSNGFITEIACLTRKYQNLEFIYRIYGLHESLFNNLQHRCLCGQINNLLDYFHQDAFTAILHDKFFSLRENIRRRHMEAVNLFIKDKKRINKEEIQEFLRSRNMTETMQQEIFNFIEVHYRSLRENYALPRDFDV